MSALTGLQKIALTTLVVVLAGGALFFFQSQAGTTIGLVSVEPGFVCGTSTVLDADANVYDTVQIGQQCWMKQSMRVGTRISTSTAQTNNGVIEYYCIDNLDSNCTDNHPNYPDGGLYRFDEAMQYSNTPGAQGICPSGWHIPTHDEWTTLERAVCTSGTCATDFPYDTTTIYSLRGTDEGDKLGPNGSSGFEGNYAASFFQGETYGSRVSRAYLWSSTRAGVNAWGRELRTADDRVYRGVYGGSWAQSVRCLKDAPTTDMGGTITTNPDLERGLVGHWTFDGEDFTDKVYDRSGNGNHAYVYGAATSVVKTLGVMGQAVKFDGVDDMLNAGLGPSITDVKLQGGEGETYSVWIYPTAVPVENAWIVGRMSRIEYDNTGRIEYNHGCATGNLIRYSATGLVRLHEWQLITVTAGNSSLASDVRMYINGQEVLYGYSEDCVVGPTTPDGSQFDEALTIGKWWYDHEFIGSLDDLRIYNRALSADEVKRLYQLGATTKIAETITTNPDLERGLVGHWTFDGEYMDWGSTTAEVRDRSGNGNHGDALGGMTTRSNMQGMLGQAMGFDGTDDYISIPDTAALTFGNGTADQPLSLSAWVYYSDTRDGDFFPVISKYNDSTFDGEYAFGVTESGFIGTAGVDQLQVMLLDDGATVRIRAESIAAVPRNEWVHIVATYDGSGDDPGLNLYLNGSIMAVDRDEQNDYVAMDNEASPLTIGAYLSGDSFDDYGMGKVDDARIYNRALSADEVRRLYDMGR